MTNTEGLLLVVPSPHVASCPISPEELELILAESAPVEPAEVEAEPTEIVLETPNVDVSTPTESTDAAELAFEELAAAGSTDDRDMSAVAGVSVLEPAEIPALAASIGEQVDRLDPSAPLTIPVSICAKLEPISWDCDAGHWARAMAEDVCLATRTLVAGGPEAGELIDAVEQLCVEGRQLAGASPETAEAIEIRRLCAGLEQRVRIWRQLAVAVAPEANGALEIDWPKFADRIERMRTFTSTNANGSAWKRFLELDTLAEMAARGQEGLTDADRMTALVVLVKVCGEELNAEQAAFLESSLVQGLVVSLREVVTEPISAAKFLSVTEAFERSDSTTAGRLLAIERLRLRLSALPAQEQLGACLEKAYLQPNVRIAVTGYLLNQMMPDRKPEYQWVRDEVMGHPVRGRSLVKADLGLRLIPDSDQLRAAVTVDGQVSASTSSTAGPATFFNDSESEYSAVKKIELTEQGIDFSPTNVEVDNRTRLRQIRTDFDGIPLLGSLVHGVARSQHDKNRPLVRREMKTKVTNRAKQEIDEEVDARLGELNARLQQRLLGPLEALSVEPELAHAQTTAERMTMQLQVGGLGQLGSHTPRPWAPADSVLSFQLHQSALNNVLERLELNGAVLTIKQLRDRIGTRLNRPEMLEQVTEHDDVVIHFAAQDAARVDFEDGRFCIALGIRQLRKGARRWSNFRVQAYYKPEISDRAAYLVRDGVVELIGPLRAGSQIALRGIFSKTFAKDRAWAIIPEKLADDPRLARLAVTQLTLNDGWVGLAIGPQRIDPARVRPTIAERSQATVK